MNVFDKLAKKPNLKKLGAERGSVCVCMFVCMGEGFLTKNPNKIKNEGGA